MKLLKILAFFYKVTFQFICLFDQTAEAAHLWAILRDVVVQKLEERVGDSQRTKRKEGMLRKRSSIRRGNGDSGGGIVAWEG